MNPPTNRYRKVCGSGLHPMTNGNIYVDPNGHRHCRACRAIGHQRRKKEQITLTCSQCNRARTVSKQAAAPWRLEGRKYPLDWCRSCINRSLAQRTRKPELKVVPEPVVPDWRTPEELEDKHEYWRSRFSPDEIHQLAASLHEVLDTGGQPARKYRMKNNQRRAA